MATTAFEYIKAGVAQFVSTVAEYTYPPSNIHLATGPVDFQTKEEKILRACLEKLNTSDKDKVYGKVWELAKMQDPRIGGSNWGEVNAFTDLTRLAKALHRLGFLGA